MMALWMRLRDKTMITLANKPHTTKMSETIKRVKKNPISITLSIE